jgi:flagellar motor switch protein FliN
MEAEVRPGGEPGEGAPGGWWWKLAGEGGERLYLRLDPSLARAVGEKADLSRLLDPQALGERLGKSLSLSGGFWEEGDFSLPGRVVEAFSLEVKTPVASGRADGYLVLEESPPRSLEFAPLEPQETVRREGEPRNLDLLFDVPLTLTVELGRAEKTVREILSLVPGSVIELDRLAGEAVDVLANGQLIARGEVVVVEDNFGVRITEIVSRRERVQKLA